MKQLTQEQVILIYCLIKETCTNTQIGLKFGKTSQYIAETRSGRRWTELFKIHFSNGMVKNPRYENIHSAMIMKTFDPMTMTLSDLQNIIRPRNLPEPEYRVPNGPYKGLTSDEFMARIRKETIDKNAERARAGK